MWIFSYSLSRNLLEWKFLGWVIDIKLAHQNPEVQEAKSYQTKQEERGVPSLLSLQNLQQRAP